jgi:hypothetical protein
MLDASTMVDPALERGDGARGQDPDHYQSPCGIWPVASLTQICAVVSEIGMTGTCATLFTTKMHTVGSKTDAKNDTTPNKNGTMKARVGGPAQFRWMYSQERELKNLELQCAIRQGLMVVL